MAPFPAELLLKIFSDLQTESPDALYAVAASSQEFSRVARPLVYSEFRFVAYRGEKDVWSDKPVKRMEWWTSEDVAPLVRTCIIWPGRPLGATMFPSGFLDIFQDAIERFRGLRRLVIDDVALGGGLAKIHACLPALEDLKVDLTYAQAPYVFNPAKTTEGAKLKRCQLTLRTKDGLPAFIPFLHPAGLTHLILKCNLRFWAQNASRLPAFPKVIALSIGGLAIKETSDILALLPKFPAVQELTLADLHDIDYSAFTAAALGAMVDTLTTIDVPVELVPILLPAAPHLTHIKLSESSNNTCWDLTRVLEGVSSVNVVSLDVYLNMPNAAALSTIFTAFPQLRELRLQAYDGEDLTDRGGLCGFLDLLAGRGKHAEMVLPASLKSFMITWFSDDDFNSEENWRWVHTLSGGGSADSDEEETPSDDVDGGGRSDSEKKAGHDGAPSVPPTNAGVLDYLQSMRDAILQCLPGLTSLWLDYPPFLVTWRRLAPMGPVSYESVVFECEQDGPGIEAKDFWASR
ncbi:hypothetical protein MKEN_00463300 [Mycena kentingensis (nom. inval.)]|nr:hypothetical protein MKEN_00463300 [Mycena kentingensis (nom. inval.)]